MSVTGAERQLNEVQLVGVPNRGSARDPAKIFRKSSCSRTNPCHELDF